MHEPDDVPPTRHFVPCHACGALIETTADASEDACPSCGARASGEGKVSRAGLLGSLVRRAAERLPDRLEPF